MKPQVEKADNGFTIVDPIERHRYHLTTHEPVTPKSVTQDRIPYPIGTAFEITTGGVILPVVNPILVRDIDGTMITEVQPDEQATLPKNEYLVDISVQIKVYLRVNSSLNIHTSAGKTHIELDEESRIIVGARSYHTQPANTIITTSSPTDVMKAVSAFGSALKTTNAERSFPNSRGHPPILEVGDNLTIPREIERRETGVTLEVPPTLAHVFSVTPLAYYLGAEVVPGPTPRLTTESGYSFSLGDANTFASSVERALKQIFFLDCIIRSEGPTSLPLYERQNINGSFDFDPEVLYEQPLHKQLETYLSVPFSTVEPHLPEWRLRARLQAIPEEIPFLPFLANDLTIVSTPNDANPSAGTRQTCEETNRNEDDGNHKSKPSNKSNQSSKLMNLDECISIQQLWTTTDEPSIESTTPLLSYINNINQDPKSGPIEIKVICNEPRMRDELVNVYGTYGERDEIPLEVTIYHELTQNELMGHLSEESDFVHYIGHIDGDGFRCSDGRLDVTTIDSVNTKLFFLNACRSHNQGIQLIRSGSVAGIVTFDDVQNADAITAGSTIARLLAHGYSLYAAVDILRKGSRAGKHYHIVGNGLTTVAQPNTGVPNVCFISNDDRELIIDIRNYLFTNKGIGTIAVPYIESVDSYHLIPNNIGPFLVTKAEIVEFLELEPIPVLLNGELRWSDEIRTTEL